MMTNVIAMLHTSAAYQAAALQLMVGEANFDAQQLGLPPVPPMTNEMAYCEISRPTDGVGGGFATTNYSFDFQKGQLYSIHKRDWIQHISPPVNDWEELADRPSLLDTNTAWQLTTQWLSAIVDLPALNGKFPPHILQVQARRGGQQGKPVPRFIINWGDEQPNPAFSPVYVDILGTTKELIELTINDPSFLKRPVLQLTNADELLGPLPPPRHFVEDLLGGSAAYETVASPDQIEAWLLTPNVDNGREIPKAGRTPAVKLSPSAAKNFSHILTDFDSYLWDVGKKCMPDFGVRLRFSRGSDTVEFMLCYQCDILQITHDGHIKSGDFDPSHGALVKAIQAVFPNDEAIKQLDQ
jgi:hypothetical protein